MLQVKVQGCCCDCWCIWRNQQRGTWLLRLLVLAQVGFVVGVDIYTGLWASVGFVFIAAWASLAVSAVASVISIILALYYEEYELIGTLCLFVDIVWAPIEIVIKVLSLHMLKVAVGGDGATRTIRILFGLDIAAFAVLFLSAISLIGLFI